MKNLKVGDKVTFVGATGQMFTKNQNYTVNSKDSEFYYVSNDIGTNSQLGESYMNCYFEMAYIPSTPKPLAIRVHNEREFKATYEHLYDKELPYVDDFTYTIVFLEMQGQYNFASDYTVDGVSEFNIIEFSDFSKLAKLELPAEVELGSGVTAYLKDGGTYLDEAINFLSFSDIDALYELKKGGKTT